MPRKLVGIRRVSNDQYEVYGRVGDKQFSRRFPAETSLSVMRVWREVKLREMREAHPIAKAGTLAADVARFLKLEPEKSRRRADFEDLLMHWVKAFEGKPSVLLSAAEIQTQLDTWRAQGVAASTLNHRRQALRTLFRRLAPDFGNPVDKTKPYRQPEPEPRAIPDDVLAAIMAKVPECVTKARLWVICHTGMRHSELMRVRPEDVVLEGSQPQVFVRSGKGGRHRVIPLHAQAVEAFRSFGAYKAWGPFCAASMRKTWLVAALRAGYATRDPESRGKWQNILCEYRPYDLRHRFATRLRERGADLADVQELLGHKNIATTRRYAPVVHAKLVTVVNALLDEDEGGDEEYNQEDQRRHQKVASQ